MGTNCYLVSSVADCLIIDPGDEADFITQTILENKLKPIAIVLTHGHFDHVLGCLELKLNFDIPIMLHKKDKKLYTSANQSAKHWQKTPKGPFQGKTLKVPPVDQFIKEGDEIKIGDEFLKVIETPGHTPGSICLVYHPQTTNDSKANHGPATRGDITISNSIIFTGDTLFADGVGRTDFSYSSPLQLTKSLDQLKKLPQNTTVFPGHGNQTILKESLSPKNSSLL